MAKEAGVELHKEQRHTDPPDEEAKAYLSDLLEQIDDLCAERQGLLDQQKLCEDGIAQYSHFLNLKVNVDEILDCQHVKVRFGFLPTEGYNKLMSNYADDPYILFVECTPDQDRLLGHLPDPPRESAGDRRHLLDAVFRAGACARCGRFPCRDHPSILKRTRKLSKVGG